MLSRPEQSREKRGLAGPRKHGTQPSAQPPVTREYKPL